VRNVVRQLTLMFTAHALQQMVLIIS
jgi:hypothetical protein